MWVILFKCVFLDTDSARKNCAGKLKKMIKSDGENTTAIWQILIRNYSALNIGSLEARMDTERDKKKKKKDIFRKVVVVQDLKRVDIF